MSAPDRILRLMIELDDRQTTIWRRVEMPASATLKALHDLIQAAMPFEDYHLFEFRIADRRYTMPDPKWDDLRDKAFSAKTAKLGLLADRGVITFAYTCDFGDDSRLTITHEGAADADAAAVYPRYVEGDGRALPEDVGSLPGFAMLLEAFADPEHEGHGELKGWCSGPFDPAGIRRNEILERVGKLARCRTLGKAGFAKSRNLIH